MFQRDTSSTPLRHTGCAWHRRCKLPSRLNSTTLAGESTIVDVVFVEDPLYSYIQYCHIGGTPIMARDRKVTMDQQYLQPPGAKGHQPQRSFKNIMA